jgi:hypothetical protein
MKVLSLNYPKQEEDEAKVNKLVYNYKQNQEQEAMNDMNSITVPRIDKTKIADEVAPFSIQYAQLWNRSVRFA